MEFWEDQSMSQCRLHEGGYIPVDGGFIPDGGYDSLG